MTRTQIIATVGGVGLAVAALVAFFVVERKMRKPAPPATLIIEAKLPRASVEKVVDTLAVPIETAVLTLDEVLRTESHSDLYGDYTLTITLRRGTDLAATQQTLRDRLTAALAGASDKVRGSLQIRDEAPAAALIITLSSEGNRRDSDYVYDYADSTVRPALAQLPGVAGVRLVGRPPAATRRSPSNSDFAMLDGTDAAVALFVNTRSQDDGREVAVAVNRKVAGLRHDLPKDLTLERTFDRTDGPTSRDHLALVVTLPQDAAPQRTIEVMKRAAQVVGRVDGVRQTLALSESPLDRTGRRSNQAMLLIQLEPSERNRALRRKLIAEIDKAADAVIANASTQLYDLSPPHARQDRTILKLALRFPAGLDREAMFEHAHLVVNYATDCEGIKRATIVNSGNHLQTVLEFNSQHGEYWDVTEAQVNQAFEEALHPTDGRAPSVEELRNLPIPVGPNSKEPRHSSPTSVAAPSTLNLDFDTRRKSIRLGDLTEFVIGVKPDSICRIDGETALLLEIEIDPDVSPAAIRSQVEKLLERERNAGVRFDWLNDPPPTRAAK